MSVSIGFAWVASNHGPLLETLDAHCARPSTRSFLYTKGAASRGLSKLRKRCKSMMAKTCLWNLLMLAIYVESGKNLRRTKTGCLFAMVVTGEHVTCGAWTWQRSLRATGCAKNVKEMDRRPRFLKTRTLSLALRGKGEGDGEEDSEWGECQGIRRRKGGEGGDSFEGEGFC